MIHICRVKVLISDINHVVWNKIRKEPCRIDRVCETTICIKKTLF